MTQLGYLLRKYPAARVAAFIVVATVVVSAVSFITRNVREKPVISYIDPPVGLPGDMLIIHGDYFGNSKDTSYVELSGNRLTESSYVSWSNSEIRIIIPANTQDGLIYVINEGGKSNPDFFANESAIPVALPDNPTFTTPIISSISDENVTPGLLITISGKNFGSSRDNSNVYFTSERDEANAEHGNSTNLMQDDPLEGFITPNDTDYDYEYWSDSEIRVRVPDGATTGSLFVVTDKGRTSSQPVTVSTHRGSKSFPYHRTYLIQVSADISDIQGGKNASITLHVPHPLVNAQQTSARMTETEPEPLLKDYRNTSIFQIFANDGATLQETQKHIHQNFVVTSYSVETKVVQDNVRAFSAKNRMLYKTYTKPDECVMSDDPEIKKLLPNIIYQVKNPKRQAELIYNHLVDNYKIQDGKKSSNKTPLEMIKHKKGDAYDFAVLFASLMRQAGNPCRLMSGILVSPDKTCQNHWWCEYYIEHLGWIPVDPALGAGMELHTFQPIPDPKTYYFGNIDAQHIAFSPNWTVIKQSMVNSKVVYRPRTYALQSIWEEASSDVTSYSSYWNNPGVIGIY